MSSEPLIIELQTRLAKMEQLLLHMESEASERRVRCQYLELRNRQLELALEVQERRVVELMLHHSPSSSSLFSTDSVI